MMDYSGSNRYELLFMDDDVINTQTVLKVPAQKKKQNKVNTTTSTVKKDTITLNKKSNPNAEKENKLNSIKNGSSGRKSDNTYINGNGNGNGKIELCDGIANISNVTNNITGKNSGCETQNNRRVAFKSQNGDIQEQRNNRRNFRDTTGNDFANEQRDKERETRQFRDRENRGFPRNREGVFRKREFDRQSGSDKTGVKAVDKRNGAGAHNWGSVKQEIEDINNSNVSGDTALTDKEESSNEQSIEQPTAPEEETKEMTLDEWKAMRGVRIKPQYNIRKPNEGEDTSEWKKMTVLNKKRTGENSEEELEYDPSMYPQRVGRLQRIVDIQFNFNDGRRGGGGGGRNRFGRGRHRGAGNDKKVSDLGGGKSRQYGDWQHSDHRNNNLKVDDERQFPTLG